MSSSTQIHSVSHLNSSSRDPLAVAAPAERPKRVQVNCDALLNWGELARHDSQALATLLAIVSFASEHNEVVMSRADLARLVESEEGMVDAAVQRLVTQCWITASPIDQDGSVSEYHVNAQVVWTSRNNNRGKAKFSEPLVVSTRNLRPPVRVEAERRNFVQVFEAPAAEMHRPLDRQPHQAAGAWAKCSMVVRRAAKALSQTPDM